MMKNIGLGDSIEDERMCPIIGGSVLRLVCSLNH